jgi:hypothetical protein
MCKPVKIGKCEEGVYNIQTWINGTDAEEVITDRQKKSNINMGMRPV